MSTAVKDVHAFDLAKQADRVPFKVADLSLAEWGRKEIRLAEHEMPGLMAVRARHAGSRPLAGARIMGSLHMTIQTAVLIETLAELGADVRWVSCNIFSTQDHAAAAVVVGRPETGGSVDNPRGIPVFAWKGETLPEYWWCTVEALVWPDGSGPTLIVDDGGDATLFVHKAYEFEKAGKMPAFNPANDPEEWGVILDTLNRELKNRPGVSAKVAVVFGYGDVGKGCAQSLKGQGCRVIVAEIDPICALRAAMEGYQVTTVDDVIETADIFITATGNKNIITVDMMKRMKDKAIIGNIGHFDNEIDMAGLAKSGAKRVQVKPQYDEWVFPAAGGRKEHSVLVLAEGRLLNLGCATGHPSFVMSSSFTNQVLAQLDLHFSTNGQPTLSGTNYDAKRVYILPKKLDEEVARLHLGKLGVKLTQLTKEQADYIGVPVEGPYKSAHYRY